MNEGGEKYMNEIPEMPKSNGNKKIIAGVIIAIVLSIAINSLIASFFLKGSQGIQGTQGEQGVQGIQGARGEKGYNGTKGGIDPYVSAGLIDHFASNWLGTDHHTVQGYVINFGSTNANNVKISMTWSMGAGSYVYKTYNCYILTGHQISYIDVTYDFESQGVLSYTVTWD